MENDPAADDIRQQNREQSSSAPLVDKPSMAEKDDCERNSKQENDISRLNKRVDFWVALLPTLAFVVAAAQAAVAYYQLETNRVQFRQDQRPYVISHAAPVFGYNQQRVMMNFRNGNYGKSPALEVGGAGKVFLGNDAMQQAERWVKDELPKVIAHRNKTVLPPNIPASHQEARDTTVQSDRRISLEEVSALLTTSFSVVAVMRQTYRDITGNEYWTDSCVANLVTGPNPDQRRIVECNTLIDVK